jgi:hypothetical protein
MVLMVHKDLQVRMEMMEQTELTELMVLMVHKDLMVLMVHKDLMVLMVLMVLTEHQWSFKEALPQKLIFLEEPVLEMDTSLRTMVIFGYGVVQNG